MGGGAQHFNLELYFNKHGWMNLFGDSRQFAEGMRRSNAIIF